MKSDLLWTLEEKLTAAERASWVGASVRADIRIARDDFNTVTQRYQEELSRIAESFEPIWIKLEIRT